MGEIYVEHLQYYQVRMETVNLWYLQTGSPKKAAATADNFSIMSRLQIITERIDYIDQEIKNRVGELAASDTPKGFEDFKLYHLGVDPDWEGGKGGYVALPLDMRDRGERVISRWDRICKDWLNAGFKKECPTTTYACSGHQIFAAGASLPDGEDVYIRF